MAEGVDIASAVGTWLAVVLALVALFGIIAPFLLWTTLRSERHIAHQAIDDPLHLFVSSGIRIWHNTRILRRARVPRLTDIPQLPKEFNGQRKDDCLKDPPSITGWIGFCSALRAFSLPGSKNRNGDLVVEGRQTWLPAHKLWVLVLGLLGRYSDREDKGQVIVEKSNTRLDYDRDIGDHELGVLHGSIGPLRSRVHDESGHPDSLYLATYNRHLRGSLTPDAISLGYLFWLAAGCLPLGSKVLDLSMVRTPFRSRAAAKRRRRRSEGSGSSPSSSASTNSEPADEETGAAQAGEDAQEAAQRRWESKRDSYDGLDFYYLEQMEDILPSAKWTIWANAMGCDMEAVHTIEKLEICDTDDIQVITSILDNVPSKQRHDILKTRLNERCNNDEVQVQLPRERIQNTTGPWIAAMLLSYDIGEPPRGFQDAYIRRVDFQSIALAALSVPVTPRHFLFNFDRGQRVFDILILPRLKQREILHAVKQTLPHWDLDNQAAFEQLLEAAENVQASGNHSRRDAEVLYQLDSHISTISHGSMVVRQAIGLLYLTSHEFRSFIDELAASDAAAEHSSIHVNMPSNQVECVAASGEQTTWRLDFHAVFPSATLPAALPRTRVALKDLMLAALQAWARITWFAQPVNAQPLLNFVDALSDVVHVAADTQAPHSSQRRRDSSRRRSDFSYMA
jgi:hypothetical protein